MAAGRSARVFRPQAAIQQKLATQSDPAEAEPRRGTFLKWIKVEKAHFTRLNLDPDTFIRVSSRRDDSRLWMSLPPDRQLHQQLKSASSLIS